MIEKSEADDLQSIMACYHGIGMTTCSYDESQSVGEDVIDLSGVFADFSWETIFPGDKLYCMSCCSNRRLSYAFEETVAVTCDLSDPFATYNGRSKTLDLIRGSDWEFRFARRDTTIDAEIVRCDLQRTDPSLYVVGYTLRLWVEEHSQVVAYWRGVTKCEAEAIESADVPVVASNQFVEKIVLVVGAGSTARPASLLAVACLAFFSRSA